MNNHSIQDILTDYKQGKMIILMDDQHRENEGDLIMAAEKVTPEAVNFMARYARGLICLTLSEQRCRQLDLPLMVNYNNQSNHTNFTLSIEAAKGVTTGISAKDRAQTILSAVSKDATAEDIVQPGHIFPLMAKPGGVLVRAGHTEAGCDLAKLAGFEAASVIVEILNEDGSMARHEDLQKFSQQHNIKLGTVEDLIRYRVENEKTIERLSERQLKTAYGTFKLIYFMDSIFKQVHLVLIKGNISKDKATIVRVHMENPLTDVLYQQNEHFDVASALQYINNQGDGVFVLLRRQKTLIDLPEYNVNSADSSDSADEAMTTQSDDYKTYGVGAQILSEIGVGKMKILGSKRRLLALKGFDLEVVEYIEHRN